MSDELKNGLFQFTGTDYEGTFKTDLLQQYKLYVQSAENVSARRVASSRYLLTLSAALVCPVQLSIGWLRSELLGSCHSHCWDSRISAVVPYH